MFDSPVFPRVRMCSSSCVPPVSIYDGGGIDPQPHGSLPERDLSLESTRLEINNFDVPPALHLDETSGSAGEEPSIFTLPLQTSSDIDPALALASITFLVTPPASPLSLTCCAVPVELGF